MRATIDKPVLVQENTCAGRCSHEHCSPEFYGIEESGRWYLLDEQQLREAQESPYEPDYADFTIMPEWWRPDQRFAWRCAHGVNAHPFQNEAQDTRITADLETGKEVIA